MQKKPPRSYMIGYDAGHGVEDVPFENLRAGGTIIRSAAAGNFVVEKARNITFESAP